MSMRWGWRRCMPCLLDAACLLVLSDHGGMTQQDPRPPEGGKRRWAGRAGGGTVAAGGAVAAKSGLAVKLLLALKGLAVLAKFKFALSMIVSIGAYALFWGWR